MSVNNERTRKVHYFEFVGKTACFKHFDGITRVIYGNMIYILMCARAVYPRVDKSVVKVVFSLWALYYPYGTRLCRSLSSLSNILFETKNVFIFYL